MPAVRVLWALRKVYREGGVVRRGDSDRPVGLAAGEAVLFYRRYTPAELAEIVSAGECCPLGLLEKGEPAARNAELREFVRRTWQGGRVRYYVLRRARDPLRVGYPDERGARAEPLLPRGA